MVKVSANTREIEFGDVFGIPIVNEIPLPDDLAPIGDTGLYYMPEAVDPRNCERYPDSPFCGGQPFSRDFIGLEITPEIDTCGRIRVTVDSRLFFGALPEQEFQYVPPGCRNPPPQEKTPVLEGEGRRFNPTDYGHMRNDKDYIIALDDDRNSTLKLGCGEVGVEIAKVSQFTGTAGNIILDYPRPTRTVDGIPIYEVWRCKVYARVPASREAKDTVELGELTTSSPGQRPFLISGKGSVIKHFLSGDCGIYTEEPSDFEPGFVNFPPLLGPTGAHPLFISKTKKIEDCREQNSSDPPPPNGGDEPCDCMACCPNNDELLQKLLKEIQKANKAIGSDEFPAQFPKNFTTEVGQLEEIPNMAKLLRKHVFYMDEIIGEAVVKITIEDVDPTKEGNQSETMEFGNISELLAENFGVSMNNSIDTSMLIQICTKALMEAGISRKQITTLESKVDALIAHQGFAYEEKLQELPFTFTVPDTTKINEFRLEQFIKESVQKVPIFKFTGKETYAEDSSILRSLNGMIRGMFFRKVASGAASVTSEIMKLLKKQDDTINKISKENDDLDDLDVWIDEFETGFTTGGYSGTQLDTSKPFGIDYDKRPRVRRMTKPTGDNPGTGQG